MFPLRDHNPSDRTPYVTFALIALNILVFLLTYTTDARTEAALYDRYALFPAAFVQSGDWMPVFTSMFMHGGIMHIGGNMLFLWIFGDNLEDAFGPVGFLVFYLASGMAAAMAQVYSAPTSWVPMVGASGAIAGVMGGYLLLYPKARIDILIFFVIFIRVIPLPAWIMLGLWMAMQLIGGLGADPLSGGVAYWAHAGGFAAGMVFALPLWLRKGGQKYWARTAGQPPHPVTQYEFRKSRVPTVRRVKRARRGSPW